MVQTGKGKPGRFWRFFLVVLILFVIIPVLAYYLLFRVNRFSLEIRPADPDDRVILAGEEFSDPGAQVYLVGTIIGRQGFLLDTQVTVDHSINNQLPGAYPVAYYARWHQLEASAGRLITVKDSTPPRITLHCVPGHYTMWGYAYQEEGYSAWDDCDGDLTPYVTRLDDGKFVTYIVTDRAGNRTSVSRKIHFYDPVAPDLVLLGGDSVHVKAGEGFTEPGWTAQDNIDGDLSEYVKITGQVDKYRAGSYELIYSVKDKTGNEAQVTRTVVVEPIGIPETVMPEERVIYLTFDDGPGPYTQHLLDVLEKYGAKATFFVVGSEYNDVLSAIVEGGHSIGIHSVSHHYRTIYASSEAFFEDLLTMQKIIHEETGVWTYLMRFPGGSSNTVSRFNPGIMSYLTKAVEDNGFRYFDWNVDSDDAGRTDNPEDVYENVTGGIYGNRYAIVLQHDIKDYSVEAVEKILIWGLRNGYQFLGLDMTSPMAHHGVNN